MPVVSTDPVEASVSFGAPVGDGASSAVVVGAAVPLLLLLPSSSPPVSPDAGSEPVHAIATNAVPSERTKARGVRLGAWGRVIVNGYET